ncbi:MULTISPECIES: hypothetical protein [unclassified Chryseobacterium]|uniref:hypothetical protein n=1 Tax=unclassified Chryseobacterium TaxID=2593645 RepID=UPI0028532DD8|nr:hypothetical protein [Chryseobacterium sp. CFS7]MDR4892298.1 hypothetical protein [Chryseobacterium sp. CFS7]
MKRQPEFDLQKCVCAYLRAVHPSVFFMSDTIASLKLTKFQAVRNSQIQKPGFKTPDPLIFLPKGNYHGLFIELKIESPYKQNGELKSNKHIQEQSETISRLKELGYYAEFQWDFNRIVKLIEWYLKLPEHAN